MIKYLVVGTGRCGTVYMARLLTSLGVTCGHEAIFQYDGYEAAITRLKNSYIANTSKVSSQTSEDWFDSSKMEAESSYMAVPYLGRKEIEDVRIIHIVRNPLKVISSLALDIEYFSNAKNKPYADFVCEYCPEIKKYNTEVEKACCYYYTWNKMIESKSNIRLRIERQPSRQLLDFMQIGVPQSAMFSDNRINSWKTRSRDLTLQDIPSCPIKDKFVRMMCNYGYLELLE